MGAAIVMSEPEHDVAAGCLGALVVEDPRHLPPVGEAHPVQTERDLAECGHPCRGGRARDDGQQ